MTITGAKISNEDSTAVTIQTVEAGSVAIDLNPNHNDSSGGWRDVFNSWLAAGNIPEPNTPPEQ